MGHVKKVRERKKKKKCCELLKEHIVATDSGKYLPRRDLTLYRSTIMFSNLKRALSNIVTDKDFQDGIFLSSAMIPTNSNRSIFFTSPYFGSKGKVVVKRGKKGAFVSPFNLIIKL